MRLGQTIDLEPVGKKAIGLYKKKFPAANYEKTEQHYDNDLSVHYDRVRHRAQPIEVAAEHVGMLLKVDFKDVSEMARAIIARYERAEIDSVYIVYNEFKSVISQRVVVEKLLPIRKLGSHEITAAEEMTEEQREAAVVRRALRACRSKSRKTRQRKRKTRSSVRRMWTTSSTSRRSSCFAICCRGM